MRNAALYLWCIGFGLITTDHFGFDVGAFTIKIYYFIFLAAFLTHLVAEGPTYVKTVVAQCFRPPWVLITILFAYQLVSSPFSLLPIKSFVYTIWLGFDLLVVTIGGILIFQRTEPSVVNRCLMKAIAYSTILFVGILLVDHWAYYQGYRDGFIGFNQDRYLRWGFSRPHAFAYEPSYLAMYLSFGLIYLFSDLSRPHGFIRKRVSGTAAALAILGLVLLSSRMGWVTSALLGGLFVLSWGRDLLRKEIFYFGGGALLLLIALLAFNPKEQNYLIKRNQVIGMLTVNDGSGNARLNSMLVGLRMGMATNLVGTGVGASYAYFQQNQGKTIENSEYGHEVVMSIWAQLFAETGLFGFLMVAFFGLSLWMKVRKAEDYPDLEKSVALISIGVFFLFTMHWIGNFSRTDIWVWFAIWASRLRAT